MSPGGARVVIRDRALLALDLGAALGPPVGVFYLASWVILP
jgi:hypothetical protein